MCYSLEDIMQQAERLDLGQALYEKSWRLLTSIQILDQCVCVCVHLQILLGSSQII